MSKLLMYRTFVLLLSLSIVLAAKPKLIVKCTGECIVDQYQDVKVTGSQKPYFSIEENTSGTQTLMSHDVKVESNGTCWNSFHYEVLGQDDRIIQNKNQIWPWDENTHNIKKVIPVNFGQKGQPSKCQEIQIKLYIDFTTCKNKEVSVPMKTDGVNPLKSWIEEKAETNDGSFPTIYFKKDDIPTISWIGITSNFECDPQSINTNGFIEYSAYRFDISKLIYNTTLRPFKNMFETQKYPNLTKDEKCHSWTIKINVVLKFYTTKRKKRDGTIISIGEIEDNNPNPTFIRETKKTNPSNLDFEIVERNNASNTETHLKLEAQDKTDLKCLNKQANITQWSSDGLAGLKIKTQDIIQSSKIAKVSLTKFLDKTCVESQIIVNIHSVSEPAVVTKTTGLIDYIAYPKLERCPKISENENTIKLKVANEQFQECDLTYRINCTLVNSTSANATEVFEQKNNEFTIEDLYLKECDAIAFIKDPNEQSRWFIPRKPMYCTGASTKNETTSLTVIAVIAIISGAAALSAALIFLKIRRTKRADRTKIERISIRELKDPHFVIKKNDTLTSQVHNTNEELATMRNDQIKETLRQLVEQQDDVVDEFNKADESSRREITGKETSDIAKSEINKFRNRYTDMVPYDSNIIYLKVKTGNPPSSYMNASLVKFEGMKQDFVAIQAPKPIMFDSFWQLVWEQNVSVIVMITGLVEGGRTKANQYWPDKDEPMMEFGNVGLTVKYVRHSYPGTYFHRRFVITNERGEEKKIDHLQTDEWADMTAPRTTKILLDLVYKTDELMDERSGPIMVHCSAGVGRTGTYIGLYKLINDYNDDNVEEIDFYQTLIEMRRQRMMMIQKPLQYHYMIKCLGDYVARETSDYA